MPDNEMKPTAAGNEQPNREGLTQFSTLKVLFGVSEQIAPSVAEMLARRGQLVTAGRDGNELLCTRVDFVAAMQDFFERVPMAGAAYRERQQAARYWDSQRTLIERGQKAALARLAHVSQLEPKP